MPVQHFLLVKPVLFIPLFMTTDSENTFNKALKRMGYDTNTHRAHGFRTTASTNLNEQGFDDRWIEKQLAHEIENKVTASYNKAEYFEDRKAMMQSWSDYLEKLMLQAK